MEPMKVMTLSYNDVVRTAAQLCGPEVLFEESNDEYVRAQVELICDMFGIPMDDKEQVLNDMRRVINSKLAIFKATIVVEFDKSDDDATAAQDALNEYAVENNIVKAFELTRIEDN